MTSMHAPSCCSLTFTQNPQCLSLPLVMIPMRTKLSLPPANNQWYKGDHGDGGEGTGGRDSTDGGVGSDDDLLKTPPPLPPALPPLPQADPNWYKSGDESSSVEAGSGDDGAENDDDLYSVRRIRKYPRARMG